MIDTVRLLTRARPTAEQLTWWNRHETNTPAGKCRIEYYFNPSADTGIPVRATYRPESIIGLNLFVLEMSLPRILFGSNWQLVLDIEAAITAADRIIASVDAFPPLPSVAHMTVSRLDICYNYPLGHLLPHYLNALARLHYARRDSARFNTETVEFRAKSVKSKFYDKHRETNGEAPAGLLRHEVTLHRAGKVKWALGFKRPVTLRDLHPHMLKQVLDDDLDRLGIRNRPFRTSLNAAQALIDKYGPIRGPRIYGVLTMYQQFGPDQIADMFGITQPTVTRLLADVRKANMSTALTDTETDLPPLTITLPTDLPPPSPKTCTQTPGVTSARRSPQNSRTATIARFRNPIRAHG